ncbi:MULTISPECIES: serine O-acetyltransferase EpsC [unclassified Mucilaginibacter]|uniref:serine O-acetyltransferase EpsC n=1 Tax=unclassified Mucilaginibacter TaxID=2617802 RepID=UPI0031F70EA3
MSDNFYQHLFEKQQNSNGIPANTAIAAWALSVIHLLYPEQSKKLFATSQELKLQAYNLQQELSQIINTVSNFNSARSGEVAGLFFDRLPELYNILNTDIQAIYEGDPAARSEFEVIRTYPGFYAISIYRIAHTLVLLDVPLVPRILTEHAHSVTGIDIHPAASIGEYFHIDHGTGIVIGETCTIGKYVKMYQGVTLGALSVRKTMAGIKRHPTVEDRVVIYSGATILGGDTVIGHNSTIGGNVWLTQSVAPYSTVYHNPMITVQNIIADR